MPRFAFTLDPRGPFSMAPIRDMQCGFLRGSRTCGADPQAVRLAFPQDGDFSLVGAEVRHRDGQVHVQGQGGTDPRRIRAQIERTLGLDHDGIAFQRTIQAHPALARVAAERPDFRPVVAYSPYVMGGWAVLSQRLRMAQAAAIQVRIAEACGDVVEVDGERIASFPRPQSLLALSQSKDSGFPGVAEEKWRRLQVLAEAALRGDLEVERLRALPYAEARAKLMELRGVGPWTADAILLRGVGPADALPLSEPRLHEAVAATYGLRRTPSDAEVSSLAESWRPFRMWVSVLLVSHHWRSSPRVGRASAA
jgi:DNA-3-methyladenine glycosylase II